MEPDNRTRWRCRRGMLENDWLLGHFLAQGYAQLDQEGRDAFERLLDYPDNVLLDVVMGRQTTVDEGIARLVPAIRAATQASAPT
ncbi:MULTISPECIES: succinate dehydrogenase assembly factor 2 [unclassified Thioalkalivibrio]|uniref:FAD assembly factor SdhE n=1 Tax=unclassified Thioalkalivibrio TaxID=2621013 RepID=UPI000399AD09|nr:MULTISPECIES: succinate dehydrogenase assembly factor 2 [unclassified Thioalkalivibrio]